MYLLHSHSKTRLAGVSNVLTLLLLLYNYTNYSHCYKRYLKSLCLYQSSKFIHNRTGKAATHRASKVSRKKGGGLPVLSIHSTHIMNLKDNALVGGDRDRAQHGFIRPLTAQILPCKKYVKDTLEGS